MANYKARLQMFNELLEKETIPLTDLQTACFNGIPDGPGFRSLCWKILLNYLPVQKSEWPLLLQKQRNLYEHFIDEMIVTPGTKNRAGSRIDVTLEDHPLNPNPDGKWMAYFKDNEVLLQINKDVRRLCPDISFFQQPTEHPCAAILGRRGEVESLRDRVEQTALRSANVTRSRIGITNISLSKKRAPEEYGHLSPGQEAHWEVVERLLFLYAKLNPGQGYVQGMNEIIGPIYYTFASDPDPEWKRHAEADTFFCFTNLMSEIRDFFIKSLDDSASGIGSKMGGLMSLLQEHDFSLWQRLQGQDIKPQYFCFRWITLLLSQEFPLPGRCDSCVGFVVFGQEQVRISDPRLLCHDAVVEGQATARRLLLQHETAAELPERGHPLPPGESGGDLSVTGGGLETVSRPRFLSCRLHITIPANCGGCEGSLDVYISIYIYIYIY